jgi:hypothetical protein
MNYWYMSAVPFVMVVPFVVAWIRLKALPGYAVAIAWLLVLSGVTQLTITFLAEARINNMPFFHVYTVLELLILLFFFNRLLKSDAAVKYLYLTGGGFLVFAVVNSLYIQHLFQFNSYARSIEAIIVIALCFAYFGQQFRTDQLAFKDPGLWFVTGLFVYFASSFMIFIYSNLSLELDKYFDWVMWNIHATIVLIMYALYTVGFLKCSR